MAWQPISTAPTFQHVLAWFPGGEHVITLMGSKPTSFECVGYFAKADPTHWMPLPDPPAPDPIEAEAESQVGMEPEL